jgi:hypothetical protein
VIARAGQTSTARITESTSAAGTRARYVSRPSRRIWNTLGASCSQYPNRAQRTGSTLTTTDRPRRRLVEASTINETAFLRGLGTRESNGGDGHSRIFP